MLRWRNGSQVALNFRGRDRQDLLRRVHDDDARERRRIRNGQRGSGGSSLLGPLLSGEEHVRHPRPEVRPLVAEQEGVGQPAAGDDPSAMGEGGRDQRRRRRGDAKRKGGSSKVVATPIATAAAADTALTWSPSRRYRERFHREDLYLSLREPSAASATPRPKIVAVVVGVDAVAALFSGEAR